MASAQNPGSVRFEVASVKLALHDENARPSMRGGPGTPEPERITYEQVTFSRVLCRIYGFDFDQISGPSWLGTERYTIAAKVPPGTTKDQLKLMWESLLAERFHLVSHFVRKEFPVYELSVAKGGSKLKRSGEGPFVQQPGFPVVDPGRHFVPSAVPPRTMRNSFRDTSISGNWGVGGAFPQPLPDGQQDTAPFLIDAIRQQLGLSLTEG